MEASNSWLTASAARGMFCPAVLLERVNLAKPFIGGTLLFPRRGCSPRCDDLRVVMSSSKAWQNEPAGRLAGKRDPWTMSDVSKLYCPQVILSHWHVLGAKESVRLAPPFPCCAGLADRCDSPASFAQ